MTLPKNVYAIAAGIAAGLGYESNARAGKFSTKTHTPPLMMLARVDYTKSRRVSSKEANNSISLPDTG